MKCNNIIDSELGGTAAGAVKQAFNGVVVAATEVGSSVSKTTK